MNTSIVGPLNYILRDFSSSICQDDSFAYYSNNLYEVRSNVLPIPSLALYILVKKLHCRHIGTGEIDKVHWSVLFHYKEKDYSLELCKSGLHLVGSLSTPTEEEAEAILEALSKASTSKYISKEVVAIARQHILEGRAIVPNKLEQFDKAFNFFKRKAVETYGSLRIDDKPKENQDSLSIKEEASYYASAAVEAFYSRLEHILVLIRPFVNPLISGDEVILFMADNWGDKFKKTFQLLSNQKANQVFGKLSEFKENYRNPAAHGGFVKEGVALYFAEPLIGTQPFKLLQQDKLPVLTLCGIKDNDFADILQGFEGFEHLLQSSTARYGYEYAKKGFDVRYEDASDYLIASTSEKEFNDFVMIMERIEDDIENADYSYSLPSERLTVRREAPLIFGF